jgi:hypothetical protein
MDAEAIIKTMTAKPRRAGRRAQRARRNRTVSPEKLRELVRQSEGNGSLGAKLAEAVGRDA